MSKTAITLDALIRAKASKEYLLELTKLFEQVETVVNRSIVATRIEHKDGECTSNQPDLSGGVTKQRTLSTRQMLETIFALTYNATIDAREQAAVDKFLSEFESLQAQVDNL